MSPVHRYLARLRPHRVTLALLLAAGLAQSFAYVPMAMVLRRIFDEVLPGRDRGALWMAAALLFGLQAAGLLLAWAIRVLALRVNQDVLERLRGEALARLYELPREFHTAADADRLHVTLVYETQWIERMNQALIATVAPGLLSAGALLGILFWLEPRFGLLIGIAAPALFVVNRLVERDLWFRQERLRAAFEDFSRGVRFVLQAIDLTRSHAAERQELARQSVRLSRLKELTLGESRWDAAHQLLQGGLLLACTLATLIAGGQAVVDGVLTRGQVMAFYVTAALFAAQARAVVAAVPEVRMGWRGYRELEALLLHPAREPYAGEETVAALGPVRLEDVHFGYDGAPPVLAGVNLVLAPGRRVALLGANGSGKSSLVYLLAGFYRPRSGSLSAAGVPYDRLDLRALRARMAFVPQHPFLFPGTLRENVAYGATEEARLEEALRQAGAAAFIADLPLGLETPAGEQGVRLSGGQRQKLAIARALLRRPELLVLDEPTNHFDDEAIAALMRSLDTLPFRPTVLVISHEARVLACVDEAWRLAGGRLERVK